MRRLPKACKISTMRFSAVKDHRQLKIMENEKHPLDDLKNDEITEKREK